ncbi:ABC transporter ATP-binding protein [Leekyejoonella antrihumi]|uniref:ABC-type quaternary amine transporter n=1 Tax=Leekyejoonella antrihumi TaxID=1660198 RepID=A0A563E144_9MICO|nr:ABC transporter ATP-binding protein [Leekyejoonella antrihumi]TWP35931.1 ABC transporter ATP-binding protein [Leekyejoonella antrihumi]
MSSIQLRGVSKAYEVPVLRDVDLSVPDGEITALLGASGSGKTTLLRIIAGFEPADAGVVTLGDVVVDDGTRRVRPQHRGVGYVPQDAALFPHLSVAANVGFGLARKQRHTVESLLCTVGLTGLGHRYPHQLSGGQQQRVAVARALAIEPRIVLLDEPFGSLDAQLRETVRLDVMRILAESGTTTLLVTHDQDEAMSAADRVAMIEDGQVLAHRAPRQLYDRPRSPRAAASLGLANLLPGRWCPVGIDCALGVLPPADGCASRSDGTCTILIRPEQLLVSARSTTGVPARVTRVRFHGGTTLLDLATLDDGTALIAQVTGAEAATCRVDDTVRVRVSGTPHLWWDDSETTEGRGVQQATHSDTP